MAEVLTHLHPKPVAHPTIPDHVAMPDQVEEHGEAGHLREDERGNKGSSKLLQSM